VPSLLGRKIDVGNSKSLSWASAVPASSNAAANKGCKVSYPMICFLFLSIGGSFERFKAKDSDNADHHSNTVPSVDVENWDNGKAYEEAK
jgi:hypothetical protein